MCVGGKCWLHQLKPFGRWHSFIPWFYSLANMFYWIFIEVENRSCGCFTQIFNGTIVQCLIIIFSHSIFTDVTLGFRITKFPFLFCISIAWFHFPFIIFWENFHNKRRRLYFFGFEFNIKKRFYWFFCV